MMMRGRLLWAIVISILIGLRRLGVHSSEMTPEHQTQYRKGHVIIACALGLHRAGLGGECGEIDYYGVEAVETINMVVDKINSDGSILRGLTLGTLTIITCESPKHALERVVSDILPMISPLNATSDSFAATHYEELLAGVIGAASSTVSTQIASILQVFSIPQISHWSTSPKLSNKDRYPYFFRTVPSDSDQADAVLTLSKTMGWNYISVVHEDDFYGAHAFAEIKKNASKMSVCIATSHAVKRHPTNDRVKEICEDLLTTEKSKVVILMTSSDVARRIIPACESVSPNGKSLLWVATDGWASYYPKKNESDVESVQGAIGFTPELYHLTSVDEYMKRITLGQRRGEQKTIDPWFADYLARNNDCSLSEDGSSRRKCREEERLDEKSFKTHESLHNIANAVLAFVHALDSYHKDLCGGKPGLCDAMENMAGTNRLAKALYPYLQKVSFPAMNGGVFRFDENHDGPPVYDILTYRGYADDDASDNRNGWVFAGRYFRDEAGESRISWKDGQSPERASKTISVCSEPCGVGEAEIPGSQMCCWHCQPCQRFEYVSWRNSSVCESCAAGTVPNSTRNGCEALPVRSMDMSNGYAIASVLSACFGISLTITVAGILWKNKDTPIVNAAGKELCSFVLLGVFLTFLNCFPVTSPASATSCGFSRFILALGPAWMYAGLLVKTIHVSLVFNNGKGLNPVKYLATKCAQLGSASLAVAVQVAIVTLWLNVVPPLPTVVYPNGDRALSCCGSLTEVGVFVALVYPLVLIAACTLIATRNRRIPSGFKETVSLGFTMHTTCIVWTAFVAIFLSNSDNIPAKLMTISLCLNISAATVLVCFFGPKCYIMLFQPEKNCTRWVMSPASGDMFERNYLWEPVDGLDSQKRGKAGSAETSLEVHFSKVPEGEDLRNVEESPFVGSDPKRRMLQHTGIISVLLAGAAESDLFIAYSRFGSIVIAVDM